MDLVLVESPTKARKIQEFLGKKYIVQATVGHFRDLPEDDMGIDVENGFLPLYEVKKDKSSLVKKLKKLALKADTVYLASDLDREGEAIAFHCKSELKLRNTKRIVFNEITEKAVKNAIANPRKIDLNLVASQEARRVLDRLVGYTVSPILCNQSGKKLSAGRVQSPTLKIIAMRDQAIKSFVPSDYYELSVNIEGVKLNCVNTSIGEKDKITDKAFLENIVDNINNLSISTEKSNPKTIKTKPCFTTSKLQQTASSTLKLSPKKTMQIAQKLFENGLITYHRTDSPNLSADKFVELKEYLAKNKDFDLRDEQLIYKTSDDAQLAHEAIAPTDFSLETLTDEFNKDEKNLYKLIYERTMLSALKDGTDVTCKLTATADYEHDGNAVEFVLNDTQVIDLGWRKYLSVEKKESKKNQAIPADVKDNYSKDDVEFNIDTKTTKAPSRYKAADLIKVLEKLEIGRPSTYASIIDNLFTRKYIVEDKDFINITDTGLKVVDAINDMFFMNLKFTQVIEKQLDNIATGKMTYLTLVEENYKLLENEKNKINYKK